MRPAASFTINDVIPGVPVVVDESLESVVEEVVVTAVEVVSVKNEDALLPSVALASGEVDSVALPSVVASADAGAGDVGVSDVVMMLPSGPTSANADDTHTARTNSATTALTAFAV
ncbi:MAG: hypothetical protein ACJ74V_09965 [Gaiellaceae bacterium]